MGPRHRAHGRRLRAEARRDDGAGTGLRRSGDGVLRAAAGSCHGILQGRMHRHRPGGGRGLRRLRPLRGSGCRSLRRRQGGGPPQAPLHGGGGGQDGGALRMHRAASVPGPGGPRLRRFVGAGGPYAPRRGAEACSQGGRPQGVPGGSRQAEEGGPVRVRRDGVPAEDRRLARPFRRRAYYGPRGWSTT